MVTARTTLLLKRLDTYLGYKYADAIVGTMPNLGEHVRQVLGYSKRTHCIPMGIDPPTSLSPEPLPADFEASYFPLKKFIVAYVGSIGISNALETFFNCANMMKEDFDIHFLVVGQGDLRESFQQKYSYLPNLTLYLTTKGDGQSVWPDAIALFFR